MTHPKSLLILCLAVGLQAGTASAAVDPAQLRACLAATDVSEGMASCERLLAGEELTIRENVLVSWTLASGHAQSGNHDQAVAAMDALVARHPGNARAEGLRAYLLATIKRWPQAEAAAHRALAVDARQPFPYLVLGMVFDERGDPPQALANYEKAAARGPDIPAAQNNYCWALATANRELEKAMAACNRAIERMPANPSMLDSRGFVHFRMKNYAAAIKDYDAALAVGDRSTSYFVRGLAKLALGQESAGRADLAAAKRVDAKVATRFTAWGVGVPLGAPDADPAAALAPRVAGTGAPSAAALATAEADYASQRARLRAAQARYDKAESDANVTDNALDRLEDDLWREQDRLAVAAARVKALGGFPALVLEPGMKLAAPPDSPAASRIAAARARYVAASRRYDEAQAAANAAHAANWTAAAVRDDLDAKAWIQRQEVDAAKREFDAAIAAAR